MWNASSYRKLIRASAAYDVLVTAAFATPWSFAWLQNQLNRLTAGWSNELPLFTPAPMLMVNLLGSLVLVWAILRLRDPQLQFGRYDAVTRLLFAIWEAYALLHGASLVILAFLPFELGFFLLQALPIRAEKNHGSSNDASQHQRFEADFIR